MAGITLAIDLDEVLGKFLEALILFHNDKYATHLQLSDFFSYTFRDVWGGTEAESKVKVQEFFDSEYFLKIEQVEGAFESVQELHKLGFRLAVVTSRQLIVEKQTRAWIDQNFPNLFSDIKFGNMWASSGRKISKPELCREIGASLMIDDNLNYAKQCANAGFRTILYDDHGLYRWNKCELPLPPLAIRLTNWADVVEHIRTIFL